MNDQPLQQWYFQLPPVTRTYATLAVLTTLACHLDLVNPYRLYFNYRLIFIEKFEIWRAITNFFYFGTIGLDFLFHMFFFNTIFTYVGRRFIF